MSSTSEAVAVTPSSVEPTQSTQPGTQPDSQPSSPSAPASQDLITPTASQEPASSTPTATPSTTPKKKPLHSFFKQRTSRKKNTLSPAAVAELTTTVQSDEVQERIARNRAAARAKLLARAAEQAVAGGSADLCAGLEPAWKNALSKTLRQPYATRLAEFVATERRTRTIFPPPGRVFSAFNHSTFARTKVVILGQDPYHGRNQANGLCFSVQDGVAHPPSLRNIFQELSTDITGFKTPRSGSLEKWANQGVLLLNAVLTVRAHDANSHQNQGWEKFTNAVVQAINQRHGKPVVFMLWGGSAKKKAACVDKKRHCVLNAAHPSPLSAHRGWFGSGHFSKANAFLVKTGQTPIDWTL